MTSLVLSETAKLTRHLITIQGMVQGVGFRPLVYRLANQLSLQGWVANTCQGATIEVEGSLESLKYFQAKLMHQLPSAATIQTMSTTEIPAKHDENFTINSSERAANRQSVIAPDLATCQDCLQEIHDPQSRRYRYPFTTCTQCGPRHSIVLDLPYDRMHTTMKDFPLCSKCETEYNNMADRRFHAEAIACPLCGPQVALWGREGAPIAETKNWLQQACERIRQGNILAVKGLGGFQLWVDASSSKAVETLRIRKHRPRKPFAVLFPSLDVLRQHCVLSPEEEKLLTSPQAPIVLLRKKDNSSLAPLVAPNNPYLGAMLPYTPLHHLLMEDLQLPIIATSGNQSEEPIVIDENEALERLKGVADGYLVHNRPIARPIDDSVLRIINEKTIILRRARGFAPTPIIANTLKKKTTPAQTILAVGGHLKNTVAVMSQSQVIMSQHLGDLSTVQACAQFEKTIADLLTFYEVPPQAIACDLHPDYRSTHVANQLGKAFNVPVIPVQHHHAHISSCMAEHQLEGPVLGVAWDGAGYGTDGTIWGGEFLVSDYSSFQRVGHLRPFQLPGGEVCMQDPRRVALSLLYEAFDNETLGLDLQPLKSLGTAFGESLLAMIQKRVNSPITTSMGRLFDGISSMLDLCQWNTFEGEAAMALEFCGEKVENDGNEKQYSLPLENQEGVWIADWRPLVRAIVKDSLEGVHPIQIAHAFHQTLSELVLEIAFKIQIPQIVLSGGVFQNSLLLRLTQLKLQKINNQAYTHHQVPSNDGGLSLGQAIAAVHR